MEFYPITLLLIIHQSLLVTTNMFVSNDETQSKISNSKVRERFINQGMHKDVIDSDVVV